MKTIIIILGITILLLGFLGYVLDGKPEMAIVDTSVQTEIVHESVANEVVAVSDAPTERYSAQVDRVKVLFEQWDYTRYRLQTNELVREGEMNSERGFDDDPDATVYVLNWQASEGEQIRYVRLSAEPERLYALDGYQNIIKSGPLVLEK